VYGRADDFEKKGVSFAVQVYKFAHEMQIDALTKQITEFFKQPSALKVFAIFDLFCASDNQPGLDRCKKVRFVCVSLAKLRTDN
jgi:hypothetical protein